MLIVILMGCGAGKKQRVAWVRHFLVAVTRGQASAAASLQIFDLRNKLIACTLPLKEVGTTNLFQRQ